MTCCVLIDPFHYGDKQQSKPMCRYLLQQVGLTGTEVQQQQFIDIATKNATRYVPEVQNKFPTLRTAVVGEDKQQTKTKNVGGCRSLV